MLFAIGAILLIVLDLEKCKAIIAGEEAKAMMETVWGVQGREARLPCEVAPEVYGNRITVLTWYRNYSSTAVYSRDYRHNSPTTASVDRRFSFELTPSGRHGYLSIQPALMEDAGVYHCRVDFESSRTQDTHVQLKFVERPKRVVLLSDNGTHLAGDTVVGPYSEGDDVLLTCVAIGGEPLPNVTWWRAAELVDDTWSQLSVQRVRNELRLHKLHRANLGQRYTCRAANTLLEPPVSAHVTIDMILRPTDVVVYAGAQPVRAGPFQLQCLVVGSRPSPSFFWIKGGQRLELEQNVVAVEAGELSTVTLPVAAEDDGLNVTCCTEKRTRRLALMCSTPLTLQVHYLPVVRLTVNNESEAVNETAVLLGTDVSLTCDVIASPWSSNFVWYFNNSIIKTSGDGEPDSLAPPALTLRGVTEAASGEYRCSATNDLGIGTSQSLHLDVQYSPRCVSSKASEYGVGSSASVNLTCDMSANPPPDIYRWTFVNGTFDLDGDCVDGGGDAPEYQQINVTDDNVLEYTVSDAYGYGTVVCWGENDVSSNLHSPNPRDACFFTVTDQTAPHPPTGCVASRRDTHISVTCKKGHDGGLQQKFTMTVLSGSNEELLSVSGVEPQMTSREPEDPDYSIVVVAFNEKGMTEPIVIPRDGVVESEDGPRGVVKAWSTLVLSLGGGVGLVVLVACALVMGARELRSDSGSDAAPRARALRRNNSASCPYATDESNCDTCQESEGGSESSFRRADWFHRAVSSKQGHRHEPPRASSFRSARCVADATPACVSSPLLRHANSCRLHSLQNICSAAAGGRRREGEALCDHLLLHLPVDLPNYSIPKPPVPFYTMPRKSHLKVKSQESGTVQNFDNLPLPPPPEEFHTFRSATEILNKECPVTRASPATNNYMNVTSSGDGDRSAHNNVIISPMNTVGLPSSTTTASSALYTYPEDESQSTGLPAPKTSTAYSGSPYNAYETNARF